MTTILSDSPRTLPGMIPNPWQRAGDDWPHVQIVRLDLGAYRRAETRWLAGEPVGVVLNASLDQRERRCALAHELEHLDRGAPCGTLRARIEQQVLNATARYLLPDLDQLAETVAVYDLRRAASELWVTWHVLVDRLNGLTDADSDNVHDRRLREQIA